VACFFLISMMLLPGPVWAGIHEIYDGPDGTTCHFFNAAARLPWRHKGGDWVDASGRAQGVAAFGAVYVPDLDKRQSLEIDVTELIKRRAKDGQPWVQLLLRGVPGQGGGQIPIVSREAEDFELRPKLLVQTANGAFAQVADADTTLDCSTHRSLGRAATLSVGGTSTVLRFSLVGWHKTPMSSAKLALSTGNKQYGSVTLGVYEVVPPDDGSRRQVELGVAAHHKADRGIEKHPAVYFADGFESVFWKRRWSEAVGDDFEAVSRDRDLGFQPLDGQALRINLAKGKNLGADLRYRFAHETGHEPDEVYFRYYLRLAADWNPAIEGGKLPGISGTYNRGGWGGRRSDGKNGWSTRGEFFKAPSPGNPAEGLTAIGTYAYHADQSDFFGDAWPWTQTALGLLERNRWYCIEQYVRLNTPGERDGVFRAWIDGKPAFERTGIRFRDVPELAIEMVWVNVYHGGTKASPHDQHLYIDNVVVARQYIGPMPD
jgi:hypothetical protein